MMILNYFPNLKKRYTAMANGECGISVNLLQYNVQDRIDYYNNEYVRMRNGEGMLDDSAFFFDNCKDVSRGLTSKCIEESSKAARMTYPL